jgi:hypothetical protein
MDLLSFNPISSRTHGKRFLGFDGKKGGYPWFGSAYCIVESKALQVTFDVGKAVYIEGWSTERAETAEEEVMFYEIQIL